MAAEFNIKSRNIGAVREHFQVFGQSEENQLGPD